MQTYHGCHDRIQEGGLKITTSSLMAEAAGVEIKRRKQSVYSLQWLLCKVTAAQIPVHLHFPFCSFTKS